MSSLIIPRERLSAYQRWELNSFDNASHDDSSSMALPTAGQIEHIHQQAREEGFAAGYEEGRTRARAEVEHMQALMAGLQQELGNFDERVAQDLTALALEVARQVVGQALQMRPELVLEVVREAMNCLPYFNHHAHLVLHPDDAALVRSHMGDHLDHGGWKIFEDPRMERGDCRVESPGPQVDATLQTRWQRVAADLGHNSGWIEPAPAAGRKTPESV